MAFKSSVQRVISIHQSRQLLRPPALESVTPRCYSLPVSSEPPGESKGGQPSRPWSAPESNDSRGSRMVGAISDPSVSGDGLGLTGPGAPAPGFAGKNSEHPVKARLLEKARQKQAGEASPAPAPVQSKPVAADPGDWIAAHDARVKQSPLPGAASETSETSETSDSATGKEPVGNKAHPEIYTFPDEEVPAPSPAAPSPTAPAFSPTPAESAFAAAARAPSVEQALMAARAPSLPADFHGDEEDITPPPHLTPPPAAVASELERFARRKGNSGQGPRLSPNMTALLGGLLGLTVIGSLGVYLSKQEGKQPASPVVASAPQPVPEKVPEVEKPRRQKVEGPWRIESDANKPGNRVLKGKVGKNAFLTAIQEAGLPKSEAYRAYTALKGQLDLDHCKSSDTFLALVKGSEKTLVAFEYIVGKEEVYQAKENKEGYLEGSKLDLQVSRNQIRRSFTFDGKSFEESAIRAGFDPGFSSAAEVSLRGHSALSDFRPGDRLRVIAQEVTVLGEFSRYAGIEAMEILRDGEESRRIYFYPHPVEGGHFDKNGRAPYEGGWRKPLTNARRTSPFNMKRMHPVLHKVMPHNGTDYGAPTGTPIGATSPGTVMFLGAAGRGGNMVRLKHEGGYESGYMHMSRFVPGMKVGDRVERMQTVGYVGNTGSSTAPHLHFSMKKDGVYIDPESLSLDGLRVLPKEHREEFAAIRAKYDPLLDEIPLSAPLKVMPAAAAPEADSADSELGSDSEGPSDSAGPGDSAGSGEASAGDSEDSYAGEPTSAEEDLVAAAKTPAKAPSAAPPSQAPAAAPAKAIAPSSIFLSDAELLRMQSASDDGEVRE